MVYEKHFILTEKIMKKNRRYGASLKNVANFPVA